VKLFTVAKLFLNSIFLLFRFSILSIDIIGFSSPARPSRFHSAQLASGVARVYIYQDTTEGREERGPIMATTRDVRDIMGFTAGGASLGTGAAKAKKKATGVPKLPGGKKLSKLSRLQHRFR
jgi:hypothetical protein